MSNYTQLTRKQRDQISALLKTGQNQTEIARIIGVNQSTISRELNRNLGRRGYRPKQAHVKARARKTRFTLKTSQKVGDALIELLRLYPILTFTVDNGKEFMQHQRVARALQADNNFVHPDSAWERGTNENTNSLIRQYFPKGSDFSRITAQQIEFAAECLNHRARRCLNFESLATVMLKYRCCT